MNATTVSSLTTSRYSRSTFVVLSIGLALTIAATVTAIIGRSLIGDHIQTGYPAMNARQVESGVSFYLAALSGLGVLGALGWISTIWAARRNSRWARWAAVVLFVLGTSTALFALFVRDTSGDTGLPVSIGGMGMLPCLAGLIAVVLMWRPATTSASASRTTSARTRATDSVNTFAAESTIIDPDSSKGTPQ